MSETYFIICADCNTVYAVDESELVEEIQEHSGHTFIIVRWGEFEDVDRTEAILEKILKLRRL